MKAPPKASRPPYEIRSVGSALSLLQMLRDQGAVRISDAAAQLEVAPSTAHRIMQMLVYRGFAVQDDSRMYRPGPGLLAPVTDDVPHRRLRSVAQPILELLAQRVGETANLQVRVGTTVRFLSTVEATNAVVQVGDRRGAVLEASAASGGLALLSLMDEADLARLYCSSTARSLGVHMEEQRFAGFVRSLKWVRDMGLAVNRERTENGVIALGAAVRAPSGEGAAAVTISVPQMRAHVVDDVQVRRAVLQACGDIEAGLAESR
ncbi:helix-turn-helix domain-containing protein [Nocardiopsis sp. HNM0947]|uniref:Helix-turn-helix domain-containing protein n=1 Tax=Nocardiopsis coralli TaxID=2772213 RepID=A0ABR9PE64_9ACTN|nr:IclR family transcriptional regulator C-terminal domain-containing protein [Nocardiopsis coralli]MBE3002116.1 helix-turn-helix domain-containing protein [Nocardiopsis coralli]